MSKTNDAAEEEYSVEKVLNRRVRNGKVSVHGLLLPLLFEKFVFLYVIDDITTFSVCCQCFHSLCYQIFSG